MQTLIHKVEPFTRFKGIKVLLIEDDPAAQHIISCQLERWCAELDITDTAAEGLEMAKMFNYDLVIVNLNLPVTNGFEFTRSLRLKEMGLGMKTKVMGITALDHPMMQFLVNFSGLDEYFVKSVDYKDITSKIVNLYYLDLN